uniref:Uncharacterized protein n=1 Tax=Pseudictyota dubia TaxID=2749911 RepID=A0A7R9VLF3_9STRA
MRKIKEKLAPKGILIVGLKNDGVDLKQRFDMYKKEPNHHIYTWNPLLIANILDSAGYVPCHVMGQFDAWHKIDVVQYKNAKYDYCEKGLQKGKSSNTYNMWSIAVHPEQSTSSCPSYKKSVESIYNCEYLKSG